MFKIIDKIYDYWEKKDKDTKWSVIATTIVFGGVMIAAFLISFSWMFIT